jgi:hypothetical protein
MSTLRNVNTAAVLAFTLGACALLPGGTAAAPPASTERMTAMDAHMKSMHEMHDKLSHARTTEERQALMAGHMKLMHEGMAMHMEMMDSMMQMMMDQMGPPPAKR